MTYACLPRHLSVDACTEFVSQISRVAPALTTLEVEFFGHIPPIRPPLSTAGMAMHNLTTFISLEVALLPDAFLHLARCPRCTRSRCGFKCLDVLKDRPFAPQLRTVQVNVGHLTDPPPHIVHADDLALLFPLDLHHLMVTGCDIAVYDELVREMSEAWPNIRTLHLLTIPGSDWEVSLPGLLPLVYRCPFLTELCVNVDASNVALPFPILEIRPAFGSQHALQVLSVEYGRVTDPAFVAGFLADCFPQCHRVYSEWSPAVADANPYWNYHKAMWDEVRRLIPHFVKVRTQERRRAAMAGLKVREPAASDAVLQYVARLESDPAAAAMIAARVGLW
ncbi:hypothetical protein C8T65DRAFT_633583 [Cerioporus squamosus]|nr:hypothetical protein C8T65DRAFT_633583 [Cerioporus squamosus]